MPHRALLLPLVVLLTVAACRVTNDLGTACDLKASAADGGYRFITEGEVQQLLSLPTPNGATSSSFDFISFGATECEDLVCVRDSNAPKGTDLTKTATGYCSRPCAPETSSTCQASSKLDRPVKCRALTLTPQTIQAICTGSSTDPRFCSAVGSQSPFFCAKGGLADGGT